MMPCEENELVKPAHDFDKTLRNTVVKERILCVGMRCIGIPSSINNIGLCDKGIRCPNRNFCRFPVFPLFFRRIAAARTG